MKKITVYHSPDSDDAFMFFGLTKGHVQEKGYEFVHVLQDIESLNQRALRGELECTAASVHALSLLSKDYAVLESGSSMGEATYGPRIVAASQIDLKKITKPKIALPGELTSTTLAMKIYLDDYSIDAELINCNFEEVQKLVLSGAVDAGAIIHEGQLTYAQDGLTVIADLGTWWWERSGGLPLPLGVNIIRRDLGEDAMRTTGRAIRKSIEYGLANRDAALEYALSFGRGITPGEADQFVGMYVNRRTVDIGEEGKRSLLMFLSEGEKRGFLKMSAPIEFISCA